MNVTKRGLSVSNRTLLSPKTFEVTSREGASTELEFPGQHRNREHPIIHCTGPNCFKR